MSEQYEYENALQAEVDSWVIEDPIAQAEKLRRERIRHYMLARNLLLDKLDTENMDILEVGGGPLPLSDVLPFKSRLVVDPLSDAYRAIAPCTDHLAIRAEELPLSMYMSAFDLAIVTNALDHVESPKKVAFVIQDALRAGGYAAIACATHNAITHPHEAHIHNLSADLVYGWFAKDFELVWRRSYEEDGFRYGHVSFNGRRGQPAFALLLRKCIGY